MAEKIISISLYGDSPVYYNGALCNAQLAPEIFPGWTIRFYVEKGIPTNELEAMGAEVIVKPKSRIHSGMFWRFLAAWDSKAERVIFRDSDSRLNIKEAIAVKAWEESGLDAHEMKDHPHHSRLPMSGGMWGIKCRVLPNNLHREVLRFCRRPCQRVVDMRWLRDRVHPLIEKSILRHSSVITQWPNVPFPLHPEMKEFCGQQYDEKGNPIWPNV